MQDKIRVINENLGSLKECSNIAIWGAGLHTCKLLEKTELLIYNVKTIVDIDRIKQGNRYFGFIVENPEHVVWDNIDAVVISVPRRDKQIAEMLFKYKFSGKVLTLYEENEITPFYLLYEKDVPQVQYVGEYDNWSDAYRECEGYEDECIINKVISSVNKVIEGGAIWERDSYLFYETKYVYQICAAVLRCAIQNCNKGVRILDIGGSLGSTYFQNRKYLEDIADLEYVVAEQDHFADYGHKNLEDGKLSFIKSADILEEKIHGSFDIVLMSASIQYIPEYEEIISRVVKIRPRYIIFDRLLVGNKMRICKENVPAEIYKSSYPVIIFTEERIKSFLKSDYELIESDISSVPEEVYFEDGRAVSKYLVFRSNVKKQ